jgi:hypothetical protein
MIMRVKILAFALTLVPTLAQEGHPLVGSWHGTWGSDANNRTDVTLVMNWDGKTISGMINPGPDVARFQTATLEPNGWIVHFEADAKDRSGKTVRIVIDGKIEDVTNVRRSISGTWTQGGVKGNFKVVRDN